MLKKNNIKEEVWLFNFALEGEALGKIERKKAEELMEVIIEWAENNGCQVGGGYRAPRQGEFEENRLFDFK